MRYNRAHNAALDTLAMLAEEVIFMRHLVEKQRDEDDVQWAEHNAELIAAQAEQFARTNYNVVINNTR